MSGTATTVRVCPIDGPTLFALVTDARVSHRDRVASRNVELWRCTKCWSAGTLPAWAK